MFVIDDRTSAIVGDAVEELNILLLAIELDDPEILDQLVSEGLSFDGLPNSYGVSSLYMATYRQAPNSFAWAVNRGVDPNLADAGGLTPLAIASMQPPGEFDGIRRLLAAGAVTDIVSADGMTPLAIAIWSGNLTNAMSLVEAGANVAVARDLVRKRS
ncbi:MAG: ankyrin repeat domain-containing protein, partial [Woeseia sp.]